MNEQFWGDMLGVLKDIGSYLEKQDATIERAKIDRAPKIQENPAPIKGGQMPGGFGPAPKVAKSIQKEFQAQDEALDRDAGELAAQEQTFLKEEGELEDEIPAEDAGEEEIPSEEEEEGVEEGAEEDVNGDEESMDELKSLLKDIRSALAAQSNVQEVIKSELKKSLPNIIKGETDRMLRKQGFIPTRPDIQKVDVQKSYGVDTPEETTSIKKSEDKIDMDKVLTDMSKKSWTELGQLREKTQGFSPFTR